MVKSLNFRNLYSSIKKKIVCAKNRHLGLPYKLARKNISRSKYRSALLIFGITLTIALETGIVISVDTLGDDFIFSNRNQNYTDISVIPKMWMGLSSLQSVTRDIRSVVGVTRASPVYNIPVNQVLKDQIPDTNILIYGIDPESHPDFLSLNLTHGERSLSNNTVIVSHRLFIESGYQIGDLINTTDFDLDLESKIFKIGGVIGDPSFFGNNIGYFFILVDIETLYEVVPQDERSNILRAKIDISIKNLLNIKNMREKIKDKVGIDFYVWNEKDISEIEASGIRTYQTAMNLVILASFIVEFLFIANILAIAIRDRSKEFGILRAIGTHSQLLVEAIAIELLIYSIIGSILGMVGGIGFAFLLVWRMQSFYPSLSIGALSLHSSSLMATFSSGIFVSLISGLYPIFLALSMPVIQNIHSYMRSGKSSLIFITNWKYTVMMGILLALTGFMLQYFVGPSGFLDFEILSIHFFVILLIFFGVIMVEVGILVFLPKIAFKIIAPIFGVITRTISIRNIAREFQKSLLTIITSALALSFIIVVGLVSSAVVPAVPTHFREQWGKIDLVAEAKDGQLPDINLTRSLDGNMSIIKSSFIQEERTDIQGIDSYVYGVDPLKYAYFAEDVIDSMRNYTSSTFLYLYHSEGNYSVNATFGLVSEFLFQKLHSPLGSNVSVKIIGNKTVNVTVAAVIKSNVFLGNGEYLYISTTRFQEFFNSTLAKWFVCDVEGDLAYAQIKTEIGFPQFKEVIAIDFYAKAMERSLAFQSAIFQILFIESFILAAIAQSICILVSTLRMEREMGIMRAIGLNKRGVFNIFMSESVILGFSALVIGVLNGLIGSILLAWYIRLSIPIEIEFPLNQIILWIVFSFLITVASTILVSYRSSSKSVIATIARRPFYHNYETLYLSQQVFYPFWNSTASAHSASSILESPLRSSLAHEQMKADYPHPSTSLWHFIKNHTLQIQVIFIVLLVIASFNYIFDGSIIIRGLNPFDIVWRLTLTILPIKDYFNEYYPEMFLFTNPFFIILALAVIAPISYYFINDHPPANPIVHFGNNFAWGLVGIIFCFLTPFVLIAILITVILPVSIVFLIGLSSYSSSAIIFYFSVVITLTILGLELFLFQRLWVFLVFNGISSGYTFRQKITWVRKIGSKGQIKFIGLILIHSLIQYLLFLVFQPTKEGIIAEIPNPFPLSIVFPLSKLFVNPVVFFILITFEIGFFLFLIIYQIVQFQNQSHLFFPSTTLEPSTKRTILTIYDTDVKYLPTTQKKDK